MFGNQGRIRSQSFITFARQMRVVVFFVCLCFLLLGRDVPAYAGVQNSNISYSLVQQIEQSKQVKFTGLKQHNKIIEDISSDKETEYLINDDAEDDDDDVNIFFAGKYRLPARCSLAGSYQSILSYLCKYFKAPPFFGGKVSCKYIVQRALRI